MSDPIEFLDLDDLVNLARTLLGEPPPIRDIGLLGSAVARPQTTAFGEDAYVMELLGRRVFAEVVDGGGQVVPPLAQNRAEPAGRAVVGLGDGRGMLREVVEHREQIVAATRPRNDLDAGGGVGAPGYELGDEGFVGLE